MGLGYECGELHHADVRGDIELDYYFSLRLYARLRKKSGNAEEAGNADDQYQSKQRSSAQYERKENVQLRLMERTNGLLCALAEIQSLFLRDEEVSEVLSELRVLVQGFRASGRNIVRAECPAGELVAIEAWHKTTLKSLRQFIDEKWHDEFQKLLEMLRCKSKLQ